MEGPQETIVLGGGCFWCLDAGYRLIDGVIKVECGYAGGDERYPSYIAVSSGSTGHAEVVRVTFNALKIQLADILDIFWVMHDPTTLNRQGADVGTQYRSIILHGSLTQKQEIDESLVRVSQLWDDAIVTEVAELQAFYPAEPEHQEYFKKHPEAAYCQIVINPKLTKLRNKFQSRIKQ
jgi:methionine-S-sulfoxide reductase